MDELRHRERPRRSNFTRYWTASGRRKASLLFYFVFLVASVWTAITYDWRTIFAAAWPLLAVLLLSSDLNPAWRHTKALNQIR